MGSNLKQRKPNRHKEHNYSQSGYYFITICTKFREEHFGTIVNNKLKINNLGEIAYKYWYEIPYHFPQIDIDKFVIMPNHIHGIIVINDVEVRHALPLHHALSLPDRRYQKIPVVIGSYKSAVSRHIRKIRPYFEWQRSYHDRFIRNDGELLNIREYIVSNPFNWSIDRYNS